MRGLIGRLNHRDAVLSNLNALLLLYPPKRQFLEDFPKLKSVVRTHLEDGVAAPLSALQIAETIIENFLRQLDATEQAAVLDALIATGRQGFAEIAEGRVKGGRDVPAGDHVTFVARLTGVAIFMAGRLVEEGAIGRSDHEDFVKRLAASLGAQSEKAKILKNSFVWSRN